jgi:hypothetical protein
LVCPMQAMDTTSGPRIRSATASSISSRSSGSRSSGSNRTPLIESAVEYAKLSHADDDDDDDDNDKPDTLPTSMRYNSAYASAKSTACPQCCFLFSFAGIIFLSTIALLLKSNSPYIKISESTDDKKVELASSVMGAVYMYIFTFVVSGFMIFKPKGVQRARVDGRTNL